MNLIKFSELVALIDAHKGAKPVGIRATTDTKAHKTNNPHGKITKTVRAVGMVGANYEKSVNSQLQKSGIKSEYEFEASKLPWGTWLIPNKVITHKGKLYLRTQTTSGMRRKQAARVLYYRDEKGQFISKEEARKFIPEKTGSAKQADVGLEEPHAQVWVNTYMFDSLDKIRIGGKTYKPVAD